MWSFASLMLLDTYLLPFESKGDILTFQCQHDVLTDFISPSLDPVAKLKQ